MRFRPDSLTMAPQVAQNAHDPRRSPSMNAAPVPTAPVPTAPILSLKVISVYFGAGSAKPYILNDFPMFSIWMEERLYQTVLRFGHFGESSFANSVISECRLKKRVRNELMKVAAVAAIQAPWPNVVSSLSRNDTNSSVVPASRTGDRGFS